MTNKLKSRISSIFNSPLCSRRNKTVADVTEHPFFYPQTCHDHHHLIQLFSPKKPPFQPFCKPKTSHTPLTDDTHFIPRSKVTGRSSFLLFPAQKNGPKNSLHSPPNKTKPKQRKSRKCISRNSQLKSKRFDEFFDSVAGNYSNYWFISSDDEDEAKKDDRNTLFSSKSLSSSDSSQFHNRNKDTRNRGTKSLETYELEKGLNFPEEKMKDSFAVVKRSSDPYNDFRESMVEMIVEKQLFDAKDLENLLHCFLSLNSTSHHNVIIQVFLDIWETLFSRSP